MKLRDLLNTGDFKNRALITIGPDDTIAAAIQKLIEHDKGSLSVTSNKGELMGIITERDIVRKSFKKTDSLNSLKVRDIMTAEVAIGQLDDDLEYAISVMKQKRIRHLPIVDGSKVIGMISMRDLLGMQLNECQAEIRYAPLIPKIHPRGPRLV